MGEIIFQVGLGQSPLDVSGIDLAQVVIARLDLAAENVVATAAQFRRVIGQRDSANFVHGNLPLRSRYLDHDFRRRRRI